MRSGSGTPRSVSEQWAILGIALLLGTGWLLLPAVWMLLSSSLLGIWVLRVRYRCPHCQGKRILHGYDDTIEKTFRGHTCYACSGRGRISPAVSKVLIAAWKYDCQSRKKQDEADGLSVRQQTFLQQWGQNAANKAYTQRNTEMIKRLRFQAEQYRQKNRAIYQQLYDAHLHACIQNELDVLDDLAEKMMAEAPVCEDAETY
jgi:hypothetical protein